MPPAVSFGDGLAQHLAGCSGCRQFQQTLLALDTQLARNASPAVLPADFAASVLARLPSSKPRLSAIEIAELQTRYEHEYRAVMATLGWKPLFLKAESWLRLASFAALCGSLGWLLADPLKHLPPLGEWVQTQSFALPPAQLLAYGLGGIALGFAVLVVKRPALLCPKW